jgi:hypothetical protein
MTLFQRSRWRATAVAVVCLSVGWTSVAHAQGETVATEKYGPNRTLIRTGILVLGMSYVPAFFVASTNPRPDDDFLYYPIAGPWLDLAHREPCGTSCGNESLNKALLITDGIFQGIGALEIVGSFFFMETRVAATSIRRPRNVASTNHRIPVSITPNYIAPGGYGIMAAGEF